jgi:hypothetical protein
MIALALIVGLELIGLCGLIIDYVEKIGRL